MTEQDGTSTGTFSGHVNWYNRDEGCGFIACSATHQRYKRDVILCAEHVGELALSRGTCVSFRVEINEKRQPSAYDVQLVSPGPKEASPSGGVDVGRSLVPAIATSAADMPSALGVILVLGLKPAPDRSPPPALLRRLDTAAELHVSTGFPLILSGADVAAVGISEAELMQKLMLARRVGAEQLVLDDHAMTTVENFVYGLAIALGLAARELRVVTSAWHMPRALYLLEAILAAQDLTDKLQVGAHASPCVPDVAMVREEERLLRSRSFIHLSRVGAKPLPVERLERAAEELLGLATE